MILSALLYMCIVNSDGNKECDVRASRQVEMASVKDCEDYLSYFMVEMAKDVLTEGVVVSKTYIKCMAPSQYNASLREVPITLENLGYSNITISFF